MNDSNYSLQKIATDILSHKYQELEFLKLKNDFIVLSGTCSGKNMTFHISDNGSSFLIEMFIDSTPRGVITTAKDSSIIDKLISLSRGEPNDELFRLSDNIPRYNGDSKIEDVQCDSYFVSVEQRTVYKFKVEAGSLEDAKNKVFKKMSGYPDNLDDITPLGVDHKDNNYYIRPM